MEQEQLDNIRKGAELGTGMTLADIEGESSRDILGVYLQMSHAILSLVDEVERLQAKEKEEAK